eukprot:TRINITY_DN438_c0_g1_i4.p2 TRINITY_DN438_c0_g1~~TRINITY_DN438_c0_g1_i4.p2  ORF type:complete len:284 (+),score=48.73 TRINITY_DN438_c0_g1_i4:217-1068(+)
MDPFGSVLSVDNLGSQTLSKKPSVGFKVEEINEQQESENDNLGVQAVSKKVSVGFKEEEMSVEKESEKAGSLKVQSQQKSVITLQDILSDDDEADVPPLSSHDELTRCFDCGRKHMTPNGLFMHLNQVHPKSQQILRLKATTWCPLCVVNCRHWYNMAMHVQEIHGQRCWWQEQGDGDVRVQSMSEGLTRAEVCRPATPSLKKASRGRVRQASVVEYIDMDDFLPEQYKVDDSLFANEINQEPLDRKSSFQGFQPPQREYSLELWDEEMKSLDGRMKQIMEIA